jgi:hypothetical protein
MRVKDLALFLLLLGGLIGMPDVARAEVQESSSTLESPETEQTTSAQESEAKDVIPPNVDMITSTQPITPVSVIPEKKPYDQALDELAKANSLWGKGHMEAASDTALEAYDDFIELHRIPGLKRSKRRALIRQAATIYINAGIAYIKSFVRKAGATPEAITEGQERLGDLRDVARDYIDLNKKLNSTIEKLPALAASPAK